MVKINKNNAEKRLAKLGLPVLLWRTSKIDNGRYEALLADYSGMHGYAPVIAVVVYDRRGRMIDRFNVIK